MDNLLFSPDVYDDLHIHTRAVNCCKTVWQNRKGMLGDFGDKTLKLKWCDIHARVRGVLTAMIWKDKQDVHTDKCA
jgi:hypothetical protein